MAYDSGKPMYVWPTDMAGPDGNAFMMIAHGAQQLKAFGAEPEFVRAFREEAMSGDFEKVKATIRNYFNVVVPTVTYELLESDDADDNYDMF